MTQPILLMCPPTYFRILYEINPWMSIQNRVQPQRARSQWDRLVRTFHNLGCQVRRMEPHPQLPDLVFTANGGFVLRPGEVVLGRFRPVERRGEEPHFEAWFRKQGFQVHYPPEGVYFEGAGDALFYKDRLILAHGFRSSPQVAEWIPSLVEFPVLSLELQDPRFYHLDTCLLYIPAVDVVLYYPGAFTLESLEAIRKLPSTLLDISEEDACHFVCNAVPVGKNLVLHHCTKALEERLRSQGIRPIRCNTSEFLKAGGSVRCLVLHLNQTPIPEIE